MKNHFPKYFHLIYETDLPNNSFLINNTECDVPCIFQIWNQTNEQRIKPEKLVPLNFIFTGKKDNPDISFRRVGVNAGTICRDIDNKSEQSHYFIKFTANTTDTNINKLLNVAFAGNNTVGPKSISKQELIAEFNKYLA